MQVESADRRVEKPRAEGGFEMWYIIGAIIALLIIVFALRMVVDVLCAFLSLINAGLGSLVRMDQKSRDKWRWNQVIRSCQQTAQPVSSDGHPPAVMPWLIAAAIALVFGMAFALSGCASAPPAAVSEYRAPRYVQRPAPQPYCDDACRAQKNVVRPREVAHQEPAPAPASPSTPHESYHQQILDYAYGPVPGMPDLSKTVYLSKGAIVCDSISSMVMPGVIANSLRNGTCMKTSIEMPVLIVKPRQAYVAFNARRMRVTMISLPTQKSVANTFVAWTSVKNLHN
jgi:hypothetical protein